MFCDAMCWEHVKGSNGWHTRDDEDLVDTHLLSHVILTGLQLMEVSDTNKLPNSCNKKRAMEKNAMKLSDADHDFMMDEMLRRVDLEEQEEEEEDKVDDVIVESISSGEDE